MNECYDRWIWDGIFIVHTNVAACKPFTRRVEKGTGQEGWGGGGVGGGGHRHKRVCTGVDSEGHKIITVPHPLSDVPTNN